jgi:adenosine kinase
MTNTHQLVGFCNPLLDISAEVTHEFLQKYGLEPNNAILADESHQPLYKELVESFKVDFIAGGAAQNSIRVAQWLLPPQSTAFFGCVGKDEFAATMRTIADKDGVRVVYQEEETTPTGTCAVLITGKNRSLVANLAAANKYHVSHVTHPDNWRIIESARYFYISGFFLTVSPETIITVAKHAHEQGKTFAMNLSAPFLCQFFKDPMVEVLPYVDILFGNETEAAAFADSHNFGTKDVKEIALKLTEWHKHNGERPRMVVITQGENPTIVAQKGQVTEHPIVPIEPERIVDTNGAGDAFGMLHL